MTYFKDPTMLWEDKGSGNKINFLLPQLFFNFKIFFTTKSLNFDIQVLDLTIDKCVKGIMMEKFNYWFVDSLEMN